VRVCKLIVSLGRAISTQLIIRRCASRTSCTFVCLFVCLFFFWLVAYVDRYRKLYNRPQLVVGWFRVLSKYVGRHAYAYASDYEE
jgi:hypothetical protein